VYDAAQATPACFLAEERRLEWATVGSGAMNLADVIERVYLPLLTQETAVMVSTFIYGLKAGMTPPALVAANSAAVVTDLGLFFLPAYVLSARLHGFFERRYQRYYDRTIRLVDRIGVFPTATALAFVMPSVVAMVSVGLLRLAFWRGVAGLLIGSMLYVAIPLVLALPLAATLPAFVVPALKWVTPVLALVVILVPLLRAWRQSSGRQVE